MLPNTTRYTLVARLYGFVGDYQRAAEVATEGLTLWPDSPHLRRHRGEFRIVLRDFQGAFEDLARAVAVCVDSDDEVEFYRRDVLRHLETFLLDGSVTELPQPIPVTEENLHALQGTYKASLKSSAWYHLALDSYLLRDFAQAAADFRTAGATAIDDDMRVAAGDWLYMSLRRVGDEDAARRVLQSYDKEFVVHAPNYLRRLRMYQGRIGPADLLPKPADKRTTATLGYGLGNWMFCNGDINGARLLLQDIVERADETAFGYIAAEQDLKAIEAGEGRARA